MIQRPDKRQKAMREFFMLPNEIFSLGLSTGELAVYAYLLRRENRETFQCYPSYRTIGRAIGKTQNSVRKYVAALEDRGLIYTEPTTVRTKEGHPRNGNLRYTIRPIQDAVQLFHHRQMAALDAAVARRQAQMKLGTEKPPVSAREPLCGVLETEPSPSPTEGGLNAIEPLPGEDTGTKEKAG